MGLDDNNGISGEFVEVDTVDGGHLDKSIPDIIPTVDNVRFRYYLKWSGHPNVDLLRVRIKYTSTGP
jgi:hypothetical protein